MIRLIVTDSKAALLSEALDSHLYWQLSEANRRDSGNVLPPYTEEEQEVIDLQDHIDGLLRERRQQQGEEEPRYTILAIPTRDNVLDEVGAAAGIDLVGLVDEKKGGVVGYLAAFIAEDIVDILNSKEQA